MMLIPEPPLLPKDALGRALDYYDVATVDNLVAQLEANDGRPSVLIDGIVNSAAFQQSRLTPSNEMVSDASTPSKERVSE